MTVCVWYVRVRVRVCACVCVCVCEFTKYLVGLVISICISNILYHYYTDQFYCIFKLNGKYKIFRGNAEV